MTTLERQQRRISPLLTIYTLPVTLQFKSLIFVRRIRPVIRIVDNQSYVGEERTNG